jgi:hypothetical protein
MIHLYIFVSVQWPYIILPAWLLLVVFIFLVATIVANGKGCVPLWKPSALAPFFHGLDSL